MSLIDIMCNGHSGAVDYGGCDHDVCDNGGFYGEYEYGRCDCGECDYGGCISVGVWPIG